MLSSENRLRYFVLSDLDQTLTAGHFYYRALQWLHQEAMAPSYKHLVDMLDKQTMLKAPEKTRAAILSLQAQGHRVAIHSFGAIPQLAEIVEKALLPEAHQPLLKEVFMPFYNHEYWRFGKELHLMKLLFRCGYNPQSSQIQSRVIVLDDNYPFAGEGYKILAVGAQHIKPQDDGSHWDTIQDLISNDSMQEIKAAQANEDPKDVFSGRFTALQNKDPLFTMLAENHLFFPVSADVGESLRKHFCETQQCPSVFVCYGGKENTLSLVRTIINQDRVLEVKQSSIAVTDCCDTVLFTEMETKAQASTLSGLLAELSVSETYPVVQAYPSKNDELQDDPETFLQRLVTEERVSIFFGERAEAEELLARSSGKLILRYSASGTNKLALTYYEGGKPNHTLITITGSDKLESGIQYSLPAYANGKLFPSCRALIEHVVENYVPQGCYQSDDINATTVLTKRSRQILENSPELENFPAFKPLTRAQAAASLDLKKEGDYVIYPGFIEGLQVAYVCRGQIRCSNMLSQQGEGNALLLYEALDKRPTYYLDIFTKALKQFKGTPAQAINALVTRYATTHRQFWVNKNCFRNFICTQLTNNGLDISVLSHNQAWQWLLRGAPAVVLPPQVTGDLQGWMSMFTNGAPSPRIPKKTSPNALGFSK